MLEPHAPPFTLRCRLGPRRCLGRCAHTTHDKVHATAALIRAHENATLPGITSFGPKISALSAADIQFAA
jgi:hypothetical protein